MSIHHHGLGDFSITQAIGSTDAPLITRQLHTELRCHVNSLVDGDLALMSSESTTKLEGDFKDDITQNPVPLPDSRHRKPGR